MKKLLTGLICAVMILAMLPALPLTAGAEETDACADPSTVPANTPCLLLDASLSASEGEPSAQGMTVTPGRSLRFCCVPTADTASLGWTVPAALSYDADDFPCFAMLLSGFGAPSGGLTLNAGKAPDAARTPAGEIPWSVNDETTKLYAYDDGNPVRVLVVVPAVADPAADEYGRIAGLGLSFNDLTVAEGGAFDVLWMGMFRSASEAQAYAENRMHEYTGMAVTAAPEPDAESGCKAVTGGAAVVLLIAAAAACALKKHNR